MVDRESLPDIVDVIGEYVDLNRTSSGLHSGLCPFHDDHNPSFVVMPNVQRFECLSGSCGVKGDVIDFVCRIENVGFTEALKILGVAEPPRKKAVSARRVSPEDVFAKLLRLPPQESLKRLRAIMGSAVVRRNRTREGTEPESNAGTSVHPPAQRD